MTEIQATDEDEKGLDEFLSDPMSVFFDLNEEMLERIDGLRYAVGYAFWAGIVATLGAVGAILWLAFYEQSSDVLYYLVLGILALVSAWAAYQARQDGPFLADYRVFAWALRRAHKWEPTPKIPEGRDPLARLTAHLKATDERFAYIAERKPEKLVRDAEIKGKSKRTHRFDMFFAASKPVGAFRDPIPEGLLVMVREVKSATVEDLKALRGDAEDVLEGWAYPPEAAARVILLQAGGGGGFSDEVREYAGKNWVRYDRDFEGCSSEWSSPIELVAEDPSGTYVLGNCSFG